MPLFETPAEAQEIGENEGLLEVAVDACAGDRCGCEDMVARMTMRDNAAYLSLLMKVVMCGRSKFRFIVS